MANYDDWKAAVETELNARGIEDNGWYSWLSDYEDGVKPSQAVDYYHEQMEE